MAASRTLLIAGAGIAGLSTALALAKNGFRAAVFERAERLDEAGAGIQLSPNATRILLALGLGDALRPHVVAPESIRIRKYTSERELARVPLGRHAEQRYGAPYWVIHRTDLQRVLLDAVWANPDVELNLGTEVHDFAAHANGLTAQTRHGQKIDEERGIALIGADGLWSTVRRLMGYTDAPHFRRRTAWRATVPAEAVPSDLRAPCINLWLGRHAHLVHYPIKGGAEINIVVIVRDRSAVPGWNNAGVRDDIVARFRKKWALSARNLVATPGRWSTWALYDRPPLNRWGRGAATLVGDAAHPMLPFLAQGGAMAIEDAAVLAQSLAALPDDPQNALRNYEAARRRRTARAQRAAWRNGMYYHAAGVEAAMRNNVLRMMGGELLLKRYDWLYAWRAQSGAAI